MENANQHSIQEKTKEKIMANIKTTISTNSITAPKIRKQDKIEANRMTQTLLSYSGDEFEMFLFEWLKYCRKVLDDKSLLYRMGGSGDKGVDIYYKNDKETIYALRRLSAWAGDVYVREPSGMGYWANVTVRFNMDYDAITIPVTLDITRVEGGV